MTTEEWDETHPIKKTYFTKYIPTEGNSNTWQWNNYIQNSGWELISPSDMDAIIAHGLQPKPEFRKVKLFLCTRDIQSDDNIYFPRLNVYDIFEFYDGNSTVCKADNYFDEEHLKVIGEISSKVTWIKEGDINEDEFHIQPLYTRYEPHFFLRNEIRIKCSQCKIYH